jgi:hypothetical protein
MAEIARDIADFDGHFFVSKRGYLACNESADWKRNFDHVNVVL